MLYMSPRTLRLGVTDCQTRLDKLTGNRSIIRGDLNFLHARREMACNSKGHVVTRWVEKDRWKIVGSNSSSFASPKGSSSPDIFVIKLINTTSVTTWTHITESDSDHLPVVLNSRLHTVAPSERTLGNVNVLGGNVNQETTFQRCNQRGCRRIICPHPAAMPGSH